MSCLIAIGALKTVNQSRVTANIGWKAGGEGGIGAFAAGAGGYAGGVIGSWAAVQAGALLGLSFGPVGAFAGGLIGAGVGAY